jgi:hypothetical protein
MDLQREPFPGVEDFAQQREAAAGRRLRVAENLRSMMRHQPAQRSAGERSVGDDAFVSGAIRDFPRLADRHRGREVLLVERFERASAPDTFLEDWLEREWIQGAHLSASSLR